MRFDFDEDQRCCRRACATCSSSECTPAEVRAAWASADGRVPELWHKLAELGVLGLTRAGAHGGMGLDELDLVLCSRRPGARRCPSRSSETVARRRRRCSPSSAAKRQRAGLPRDRGRRRDRCSVGLEPWPFVAHARVPTCSCSSARRAIYALDARSAAVL